MIHLVDIGKRYPIRGGEVQVLKNVNLFKNSYVNR